ncbi:unnamed protein product [Sphenostylis stenocarpa]|uniref:mRNA capping enzyme adenylation domain-containing protein n=1 Tax=Sphenostylis stenocarpa TaxID=92480 RepID=A0AA86V575_9FABA|nr:unnamed protein product [Sphenostylis stenocarpa]
MVEVMKRKMKIVRLSFLLFFLLQVISSQSCSQQDRLALSVLSSSFQIPFSSNSDCCEWEGVKCNSSTGRVAKLKLWRKSSHEQYINYSDFSVFKDLKNLHLSFDNNIVGCVGDEGLPNLEVLELKLDNAASILSCVDGLSNLKSLYLSYNSFNTSSLHHVLETLSSKLSNLEVLDISGNTLTNDILPSLEGFTSLKELHLSQTELDSDLHIEENDGFKWPTNLQVLSLRECSLGNKFISSLSGLGSLKSLDLSGNQLEGSVDISGSKSLSRLEELTLDGNMIDGNKLRDSLRALSSSIRVLSMSRNTFNGTIVARDFKDLSNLQNLILDKTSYMENKFFNSIGELTSLKLLSVTYSDMNATLPHADWFKLKNLEELDLSYNRFDGPLPSSFGNMTSLRKLELYENHFIGQFDSKIASLTSLEHFGFTGNQFEVPISFAPFANHSNLKFIYGEGNKVILDLQPSLQTWIPKFQLQVLSLPSMTETNSLPLPRFLLHQNSLTSLDLSSCRLEGEFPQSLFQNNTKLTELVVRNCSFTSVFQLPLHPLPHMRRIDVSDNNIIGQIPSNNISSILPNLQFLNLSGNHIQGSISPEFGQMNLLDTLDLSENRLYGEIPKNISGDRSLLKYLKLSHNKLDGQIFPTLKSLEQLYLDDNSLYGSIPSSFLNSSLISLDISNNNVEGKLPSVVGNLSNLQTLSLSNNHLEGSIPTSLAELVNLAYIDLSHNNLTGSVPSFVNSSLNYIHLNNNRLSGLSKRMFSKSSFLVVLDLSYNEITNSIQDMIQDLSDTRLNVLILKGSRFTGHLPRQLCQLVGLSILDLSYNNFVGSIPNCLGKMSFESTHPELLRAAFNGFISEDNSGTGFFVPNIHEKANFTTKKISYIYSGKILAYMSGIDLSTNKLNGSIPFELGNLTRIRALNLSHNDLIGQIPATFSKLSEIESLDLSFNMLSGQIPPQLNELNSLAVFSVAHNNLSGETPERKGQFITFDESSYEGNSLLCGPPLLKSCYPQAQSPTIFPNEDNDSSVDMNVFCASMVSLRIRWLAEVRCGGYSSILLLNFASSCASVQNVELNFANFGLKLCCTLELGGYKCARGHMQFPGSHPVSLNRENLQLLRQHYYYATWKADGTRYMMLITMDGCYLIDRSFNFRRVQMRFPCRITIDGVAEKTHHFTLLDGEMIIDTLPDSKKQERRYLIYDLMAVNGVSVIEVQRPFYERWKMLEKEVIEPRNQERFQGRNPYYRYDIESFRVRRKDFWLLSTVTKLLNEFIPRLSHDADGLIFQGWDDPYIPSTHEGLLKWKYADLNLVDFLFEVFGLVWSLLAVAHAPQLIPSCVDRLRMTEWIYKRIRTDKSTPNDFNTCDAKYKRQYHIEDILLNEINEIIRLPMYADRIRTDSKANQHTNLARRRLRLKKLTGKNRIWASIDNYEVGGGYPELKKDEKRRNRKSHSDTSHTDSFLRGGDQVISVLEEMVTLLDDMNMDEESEKVAVELAAQGVIGKRVDEMESDFMTALDYMIQLAEKDKDDKRKELLEVIKETILSHLTKKCPPHVQVVGLLCRTPKKDSRHELMRRVAAGGGAFKGENDLKIHIPGANLNDIANQADDLLEAMETRSVIPDRKLLARLVLIREEARDMMGGGIMDERNHRGFYTLPQPEVDFLTKLVALKPGKKVLDMIKNVMQGKDEGADKADEDESTDQDPIEFLGRPLVTGEKTLPVRPGMFLETVSKVLSGLYAGTDSGITAQHLEWVHKKTLEVLQEVAFD